MLGLVAGYCATKNIFHSGWGETDQSENWPSVDGPIRMLLNQENHQPEDCSIKELDQQAAEELLICRLTNQEETDQRRLANQETRYAGEWQIRRVAFRNLKMGV